MNALLTLIPHVGSILAAVLRWRQQPELAAVADAGEKAATDIVTAIKDHAAAHPEEGITAEDVQAKVDQAKANALAAGDEAAARIERRQTDGS